MVIIDIENERNHNLSEKTHNPVIRWGGIGEHHQFLLLIFKIFFKNIFHFLRRGKYFKKKAAGRRLVAQGVRLGLAVEPLDVLRHTKIDKKKIKNPMKENFSEKN